MSFREFSPNEILQGRYIIVRRLDLDDDGKPKGAMGAVYLAHHKNLKREYALKQTLFGDNERLRGAFEREAQLLANLHHESLPKVTDYFTEDEHHFLVMDYIAGEDLYALSLKRGALPPGEVLAWADQLLAVLDYLHTQPQPIIHKDIKPANIKRTDDGRIYLLDFGLAKGTTGLMSQHNRTGSIYGGTPVYAPPEQLEQDERTGTDARSDIYALAVTLWQLLAGSVPPAATTRMTKVLLQRSADPLFSINQINKAVSPAVADVLAKAASLNPDERPSSAAEMRRMLRAAADGTVENKAHDPLVKTFVDESHTPAIKTLIDESQTTSIKTLVDESDPTKTLIDESYTTTPSSNVKTTLSAELLTRTDETGGAKSSEKSKDYGRTKTRIVTPPVIALAALTLVIGAAALLFFRNRVASVFVPTHAETEFTTLFRRKTDAWVDRVFTAQGAKGGIKQSPSADETTAQVWATAQCLTGVLSAQKNLDNYVPKIKNAFGFIENSRRSSPTGGWNYYGNANPYTITEIGGWVTLAYIESLESKTRIWDDSERQEILKRVARELEEIKQRQDKSGGWRPVRDDYPDATRTYSTAIALWTLIEARKSPSVRERAGTQYDESIRRGINWLLLNYKEGQGWTPNPNRLGQMNRFDGLTAQVLFVLSRAETIDTFAYIENEQTFRNAKKQFIGNEQFATWSIEKNNSSLPDVDVRFPNTEFMAEGSTFLWFPWILAELSQLARDESLSKDERQAALRLRSAILNANFDKLENYIETENLTYLLAENLLCASVYLDSVQPSKN